MSDDNPISNDDLKSIISHRDRQSKALWDYVKYLHRAQAMATSTLYSAGFSWPEDFINEGSSLRRAIGLTHSRKEDRMRADKILNSIGNLTSQEKLRLAWLISWAIDGPEQGFCDMYDVHKIRLELDGFMNENGIHLFGQSIEIARSSKNE